MSSIERARFVADLTPYSIPSRDISASFSGVQAVEIDAIAGSDHLFNTREELGALYDKLVALERTARERGTTGDLDRAKEVYLRYAAARRGADNEPKAPLAEPSARPRATGVAAPAPRILLPVPVTSQAQLVRTLAEHGAAQLSPAAERNVTGPEASAQRRIRAQGEIVAQRIERLEARAKEPGADREAIRREIELEVNTFETMLSGEKPGVRTAAAPSSERAGWTRKLPPYIRESIDREGLVIPGVPGSFRPNNSLRGGQWSLKF